MTQGKICTPGSRKLSTSDHCHLFRCPKYGVSCLPLGTHIRRSHILSPLPSSFIRCPRVFPTYNLVHVLAGHLLSGQCTSREGHQEFSYASSRMPVTYIVLTLTQVQGNHEIITLPSLHKSMGLAIQRACSKYSATPRTREFREK